MRPLMVLGCTSDAGKSFLATGLCRWFTRQGLEVAPFKAQNMSNNARVVADGEIGVAQWLQAIAANRRPDVRMNPVLVKPEGDTRSQVVVAGVERPDLRRVRWEERGPLLWAAMREAFDSLSDEVDLVIMEGAGSPAEINLADQANNDMVAYADAAALLVSDIDRGGSFAHLFGTWSLVPESTRSRIAGFVLNRFRGDPSLLSPGPELLRDRTGVPVVGVMPMVEHRLPTEEGGAEHRSPLVADAPTIAVCRFPFGSNLDEFHLLDQVAHMRWATSAGDLADADVVVLPGSKHVAADREWLSRQGLDRAIVDRADAGGLVLGICGGAMLLGGAVEDPSDVEGATHGLGLLDITTHMHRQKRTVDVNVTLGGLPGPWAALEGGSAGGYEIRHGRVVGGDTTDHPLVWADGSVLATTVHGLLEEPLILEALTGARPSVTLDATCDLLADLVDEHLDSDALLAAVGA